MCITHSTLTLTLTFDLIFVSGRGIVMDYPCVKFGDFSWSRFGFIVRTDRQTSRPHTHPQTGMVAQLLSAWVFLLCARNDSTAVCKGSTTAVSFWLHCIQPDWLTSLLYRLRVDCRLTQLSDVLSPASIQTQSLGCHCFLLAGSV